MRNLDLIKKIMTSEFEYWIIQCDFGGKNQLYLINVSDVNHCNPNEILLSEFEKVINKNWDKNICISQKLTPFQIGLNSYYFKDGFPVEKYSFIKEVIGKDFGCKLYSIFNCQEFYKEYCAKKEESTS